MNYFEWFDLVPSLKIDPKHLKRKFLIKSREVHPDFHTLATENDKDIALEQSTINNQAYTILNDFHSRLKYVLSLHDIQLEASESKLSTDFLMEMMDINEAIMELQFDFNESDFTRIKAEVVARDQSNFQKIETIIQSYKFESVKDAELKSLVEYYFKHRYLLRINENLDKLAP